MTRPGWWLILTTAGSTSKWWKRKGDKTFRPQFYQRRASIKRGKFPYRVDGGLQDNSSMGSADFAISRRITEFSAGENMYNGETDSGCSDPGGSRLLH